ncbi:DUF192 domain-containing protein [Silanimonas sp.]|jgi:uncharacterized membrane protein (UPF0127 family)|uniref:DUF192 domain-containing protein n=1 Tax=Silanimonas sp. TaxID=1929290 RepID=UPI0022C5CC7C|nr:DUF192 domain-containing protein [Silanimonas sp.]MCZ8116173.1 DUF192 domain-containing protein [Silanimonas sp.]
MHLRLAPCLIILVAIVGATACSGSGNPHWVDVGGQRFDVELADDFDERARGLMFRESMPADHGMLFVHDSEAPLAYWMKNTRIPLDILYFDAERRLVSIQRGVPTCTAGDRCPNYPSRGPAKYVLELNAGRSDALGLERGDVITFSDGIPETGQP